MPIIRTQNFELATYSNGNPQSPKLALVLPGKLDTKDYAHIRSHVDFLAQKGFLAISFDPPGTWESPGGIELYTMTNYLKAVNEVIAYFEDKPTFIMGHSRGATIATIAGVRNDLIFAFAAIMSTFEQGGFLHEIDEEWKNLGFKRYKRDLPPGGGPMVKEFKLPYGFFEDQKNYDLTEDILTSKKPKLCTYGAFDELATPKLVQKTYSMLSEPKEIFELDSDHNYRLKPTLIEKVNEKIRGFLGRYDK